MKKLHLVKVEKENGETRLCRFKTPRKKGRFPDQKHWRSFGNMDDVTLAKSEDLTLQTGDKIVPFAIAGQEFDFIFFDKKEEFAQFRINCVGDDGISLNESQNTVETIEKLNRKTDVEMAEMIRAFREQRAMEVAPVHSIRLLEYTEYEEGIKMSRFHKFYVVYVVSWENDRSRFKFGMTKTGDNNRLKSYQTHSPCPRFLAIILMPECFQEERLDIWIKQAARQDTENEILTYDDGFIDLFFDKLRESAQEKGIEIEFDVNSKVEEIKRFFHGPIHKIAKLAKDILQLVNVIRFAEARMMKFNQLSSNEGSAPSAGALEASSS